MPDITACICTHDRPDYLGACLDGLANQTTGSGDFEIVVVDSCSSTAAAARTAALAEAAPNARLVRVDRPGLSLARNEGARAARGAFIAYIDDDAVPAPDWIARIAHAVSVGARPPRCAGGPHSPDLGGAAASLVADPADRRSVRHRVGWGGRVPLPVRAGNA